MKYLAFIFLFTLINTYDINDVLKFYTLTLNKPFYKDQTHGIDFLEASEFSISYNSLKFQTSYDIFTPNKSSGITKSYVNLTNYRSITSITDSFPARITISYSKGLE